MRSYLFVPGNRSERFAKALAAGADVVIIDLEDAVAQTDKSSAREHVAEAVNAGAQVCVRINAYGTPWFEQDLALLASINVLSVMLPKAESVEPLHALRAVTQVPVIALVETALGVHQALEVARGPGVERIAFGSVDYQLDISSDGSDEALLYARSQIVVASRVAGIEGPIDGVSVALDDEQALSRESCRSRALGFAGKLCIHPRQVAVVNRCFSPSERELAWAHEVVQAFEQSGNGAVSVRGEMVDLPVLLKAKKIIALLSTV
ncbi:CoA ester lyase [Pseudomonas sp. CG7]|uniref:HpcH/HpaI aldolase/citrate lyase family protein n=1 Tax=Pseudomonas sp. CG7 TaxID=191007 RepID=UPI00203483B6|nr:CoA ester lyase [Pseudomonas sp. CG7]MCM2459410.1 CoA ester lyase [Pseudomonas sp. CG7]